MGADSKTLAIWISWVVALFGWILLLAGKFTLCVRCAEVCPRHLLTQVHNVQVHRPYKLIVEIPVQMHWPLVRL